MTDPWHVNIPRHIQWSKRRPSFEDIQVGHGQERGLNTSTPIPGASPASRGPHTVVELSEPGEQGPTLLATSCKRTSLSSNIIAIERTTTEGEISRPDRTACDVEYLYQNTTKGFF